MISITLFKSKGKVFIHADEKGVIIGSKVKREMVKGIEGAYSEKHARSYEGSMSACIHYIFFQPRVVTVEGLDEIKNHIAAVPPRLVRLSHVSGYAHAITCRPEAMEYWEKADSPRLVS